MDDLVGHALGEVGGAAAGHLAEARPSRGARGPWRTPCRRGRRSRPRRRPRSCPSRSLTPAGEQRHAPLEQGPAGAVVDHDRAVRADRERDPELAGGQPRGSSGARPCRRRARPPPRPRARPRATPGRSPPCTPDHAAILAAASFDAIPPLPRVGARCRRPATPSEWSTSTISSISEADESSRGSAVSRPGASVSSTSRSAASRWATRAARRSLSPKRISSSAMASFSLTTGTTPRSSSRPERGPGVEVLLADREVERARAAPGRSPGRGWPARSRRRA